MLKEAPGRGEVVLVPRTSRHVIELSQDERVELERRAATVTLAFGVVQRARIVLYAAEGMQDIDIAARLDLLTGQCRSAATTILRRASGGP
jgi:hypothetical protein